MVISAALAEKQVTDNSAVIDDAMAYFKFGIGWFLFRINCRCISRALVKRNERAI